jgi:hypothetical protein
MGGLERSQIRIYLGTMEVQGLTNQAEYERIRSLTRIAEPDAAKKIAGFLNKVQIDGYVEMFLNHK